MAEESGINRISLRVPGDLFERLDEKRWKSKTTFQHIGLELFTKWVAGETPATAPGDTRKNADQAASIPGGTEGDSAGLAAGTIPHQTVNTSGLSPEDIQDVEAFIGMLRDGDEELAPPIRLMLKSWKIRHAQRIRREEEKKQKANSDQRGRGLRRTAG